MIGKLRMIDLPLFTDIRGQLLPVEFKALPFMPQRFFTTSVSGPNTVRGKHGHFECHQLIFAIVGEIKVRIKVAELEEIVILEPNGKALYLPPRHWASQTFVNGNEILGCFASHPFDAHDIYEDIL